MGLFSNILDKLGIKGKEEKKAAAKPAVTIPKTTSTSIPKTSAVPSPVAKDSRPVAGKYDAADKPGFNLNAFPTGTPSVVSKPVAVPVVDVVAKLETLAAESTEQLNWKSSIVDLLKLLGIDSSFAARKELAVELGCPPEKMADSAEMNVWLHKTVLAKIAENGGNIPANMLD